MVPNGVRPPRTHQRPQGRQRLAEAKIFFGSNGSRRLEQLFDKYEISADMTYTISTSFNSLTTFVVTTSYNIALPIIKSTFEMNLTLDAKSSTALRGCVSPKAPFRAVTRSGLVIYSYNFFGMQFQNSQNIN